MFEQVITLKETKAFTCSVWMLRMAYINCAIQAYHWILCYVKKHVGVFLRRLTVDTVIISSKN